MQIDLSGQAALVTGASRGIGQAIALALAASGAWVAGTSTSEAGAASIGDAFKSRQLQGAGYVLDVRDAAACDALIKTIESAHGPITILVNNAGVTRDNLLLRMKDEEWSEILQTNLTSVFRLSRAVLRGMMKARHGRIISISSVVGATGNAGQTNYAAAKAALAGFSMSLAREVGSRNITVNCVAPGFIETDMTRALSEEQVSKLVTSVPLGRLGHVDDIANAVVFLASREAGYITGATLHVNGGMFMSS